MTNNLRSIHFKVVTSLVVMMTQCPIISLAGGDVGGAGVSIECTTSNSDFPENGNYLYDYAIGVKDGRGWYVYGNDPITHLERTIAKLQKEVGVFFENKEQFSKYINSIKDNLDNPDQWDSVPEGLALTEEINLDLLPDNCIGNSAQQIATYAHTYYFANLPAFPKTGDMDVKQLSAVYIHELFRSIKYAKGETMKIAQWNRVIHTSDFFSKTGEDFLQYLLNNDVIDQVDIRSIKNKLAEKIWQDELKNGFDKAKNKFTFVKEQFRLFSDQQNETLDKLTRTFTLKKIAGIEATHNDYRCKKANELLKWKLSLRIGYESVLLSEKITFLEKLMYAHHQNKCQQAQDREACQSKYRKESRALFVDYEYKLNLEKLNRLKEPKHDTRYFEAQEVFHKILQQCAKN